MITSVAFKNIARSGNRDAPTAAVFPGLVSNDTQNLVRADDLGRAGLAMPEGLHASISPGGRTNRSRSAPMVTSSAGDSVSHRSATACSWGAKGPRILS